MSSSSNWEYVDQKSLIVSLAEPAREEGKTFIEEHTLGFGGHKMFDLLCMSGGEWSKFFKYKYLVMT